MYFHNSFVVMMPHLQFLHFPQSSKAKFIKSRKEKPQKLIQLSSRSHPGHLVGKRTAQKDTIIDITSDSQVNSTFPYRWSPASLLFKSQTVKKLRPRYAENFKVGRRLILKTNRKTD